MQKKRRWIYIPLGILIFMCLGTVYSWSVFRKPIEETLNIRATASGLPYMMFLFFYAMAMPLAGIFIEKISPRKFTIIGGLVVSLGWFLSGYTTDIRLLILTYGLIAGGGVGIVYGIPIAVAARWFPDKSGLAVGLTLIGFGLSPLITAPLAERLIELAGPLATFRFLGIGFAFFITLLALPLRFPRENELDVLVNNNSEKENQPLTVLNISTGEMIKTPVFYSLWFCYVIGTIIGLTAIGISSPVAEEIINIPARQAAVLISLFAIFNGLGRPLFGWMTDRFSPRIAAIFSFVLISIAAAVMLLAGEANTGLYIFAFSLLWMNLGGWLAIAPAATGALFGSLNYSKNYGFVFTAYGVGAIIGTLISSRLRDIFGSYAYSFYPLIGLAVLGIFVAYFGMEKPYFE